MFDRNDVKHLTKQDISDYPYQYVRGKRSGYSIRLDNSESLLWTRNGIRGTSPVYVDVTTMDVYNATGPYALQQTNAEIVVRDGAHDENELPPVQEDLVKGVWKGWEIETADGRKFKRLNSGIRGSCDVLVSPDNRIYMGTGKNYGLRMEESAYEQIITNKEESGMKTSKPAVATASMKAVANDTYVWQVTNKRGELFAHEDPIHALTEFGKKIGTRGEIKIVRWRRAGSGSLTSTGVFFKGTFKEVVEKLKQHVTEATTSTSADSYKLSSGELSDLKKLATKLKMDWKTLAARPSVARKYLEEFKQRGTVNGEKVIAVDKSRNGSFKTNWTPMEIKAIEILKTVDPDNGIELETLRQRLAGKAYEDLKKIPAPVDKAIESLVRTYFAMKARRSGTWYILPVPVIRKAVAGDTDVSSVADVDAVDAVDGMGEVDSDTEIDADSATSTSLLGNAVIGDLKRIQSLIKTWSSKSGKGAPDKDQLKAYVDYQRDVAGYIVKKYLPKVPENYQAKIKAI